MSFNSNNDKIATATELLLQQQGEDRIQKLILSYLSAKILVGETLTEQQMEVLIELLNIIN